VRCAHAKGEAMNRARALMVWGASSHAGKSLVATALCRWAANAGIDVVPFKAQNMSNHARVVPGLDGACGEIGSAQYFQALAARAAPHVDMNPVLLKPERDTLSQVVVHGRVDARLSRMLWRERSTELARAARESYERLAARHDLIVIEGAGSPAEINLADGDYVNLGVMRWSGARALMVMDIDRGGAFAHAYGTWALLPDDLRRQLAGFVFNKFRGDAALLAPAPALLEARTGVPTLGVLPMLRGHGLPEEDGVMDLAPGGDDEDPSAIEIVVVAYPRASNLDECAPLRALPGVRLRWARTAQEAASGGWVLLPGSKQVSGDLRWLRETGIAEVVRRHAARGRPVLGICGGMQMLGERLLDPRGLDGEPGVDTPGLGLLPISTGFESDKRLRVSRTAFGPLAPPWQALSGLSVEGYEIRIGRTSALDKTKSAAAAADDGEPVAWCRGPVLGLALHGIFEQGSLLRALFSVADVPLDDRLDRLADAAAGALGEATMQSLLGVAPA
jgi:adenosylcobyric acid synthase